MGFVKYDDDLRAWVYSVSQAELERIDTKKTVSYLLGARDADVRVGDKIAITCQNICFDGKIIGRRHYEDFVALPHEKYGFDISTYNPYFFDNESAKEAGGLTLADFVIVGKRKLHDSFSSLYHEHQLPEGVRALYLIERKRSVYEWAVASSEFVLTECISGRKLSFVTEADAVTLFSAEALADAMTEDIPTLPTRKEIANGCFSDADYQRGLTLIRLTLR